MKFNWSDQFPELNLSDVELKEKGTLHRTKAKENGYVITETVFLSFDGKTRIHKTFVAPEGYHKDPYETVTKEDWPNKLVGDN